MVERKAVLANPKHQCRVSLYEEHDYSANNKKIEIIVSIQDFLISQMNFEYTKNGGKKSYSFKSKASISCIPIRRT